MQRYRLTIAYDGTAYGGWQIQPNAPTVQAAIEQALAQLTGAHPKVHGSGRTDQGVHARGQVAHFDAALTLTMPALRRALNALLPPDIRILRSALAPDSFHARKSATAKEYRYFLRCTDVMPPQQRLYETHVRATLDVLAMRAAAARLVGRRDFAAFTANPNRIVASTVRDLFVLDVRQRGSLITVVAQGEGFLYKMVRSLVGWLVRVGEGAESPAATATVLDTCIRTARVPTAPPQGLHLWRVAYHAR
jgi:tRNA pseudouridine38-40 synthase